MSNPITKLNPAAPSFPVADAKMSQVEVPSKQSTEKDNDGASKFIEMIDLPEWLLVQENTKLRVAAISLAKTATRDEWVERIRTFANLVVPTLDLEDAAAITSSDVKVPWKPLAVRQMPPAIEPETDKPDQYFEQHFLEDELRGTVWSPGFYYIRPEDRREGSSVTAYWMLESEIDPFLPKVPGEHGAKLTPFFNHTISEPDLAPTEADYMNAPVFIRHNLTALYKYYGHYSQLRYSDKLDYERTIDGTIPEFTLDVWAVVLTHENTAKWMKNALREHLWPKPKYQGLCPFGLGSTNSGSNGSQTPTREFAKTQEECVQESIKRYSEKLQAWEIDSKLRFSMLTTKDIRRLFHAADADREPGIRLWLEYLQCTHFDIDFYDNLVLLQNNERFQRGYPEVMAAREAHGWTWYLVDKIAGSGHGYRDWELRPSPVKKVAVKNENATAKDQQSGVAQKSRKDSVTGCQEDFSSTDPAPTAGDASTVKVPAQSNSASVAKGAAPNPPSQKKTLPPHLRAQAARAAATPSPTTTDTSPPRQTKPSNPFTTGDLAAAKHLSSTFTRAKPRNGSSDHTTVWHSTGSELKPWHETPQPGKETPREFRQHMTTGEIWAWRSQNPKPVYENRDPRIRW